MRRAAKRDQSEAEIIEALEACGFTVQQLDEPVDLLLARRGWTGVAECKTGKGKLRPSQVKFIARWPNEVYVLRSVEDVVQLAKPRGPNGGPMFLGEELCPICECCSLSSEPCDTCGGQGYVEVDSPEGWDDDDDMAENCDVCDGHGGFMTCLGGCNFITRQSHKREGCRSSRRSRRRPRSALR